MEGRSLTSGFRSCRSSSWWVCANHGSFLASVSSRDGVLNIGGITHSVPRSRRVPSETQRFPRLSQHSLAGHQRRHVDAATIPSYSDGIFDTSVMGKWPVGDVRTFGILSVLTLITRQI